MIRELGIPSHLPKFVIITIPFYNVPLKQIFKFTPFLS